MPSPRMVEPPAATRDGASSERTELEAEMSPAHQNSRIEEGIIPYDQPLLTEEEIEALLRPPDENPRDRDPSDSTGRHR